MKFKDLKVAFFLASNEIKRTNKLSLAIIITIATLSVINIFFTPSLIDSINYYSDKQINDMDSGNIVIEPPEETEFFQNPYKIKNKILQLPEVKGISLQYETAIKLIYKNRSYSHLIRFVDPEDEKTVTYVYKNMMEGDFISRHDKNYILIGNEVAGTYNPTFESMSLGGVYTGDNITALFSNSYTKNYKIKGVFHTKLIQVDMLTYLPLNEMKEIFGKIAVNRIAIRLKQNTDEEKFISRLKSLNINGDIFVARKRSGINMRDSLNIIKQVLSVVGLIISMTTLFIVIYINALNERKLIAILKAIGIKKEIIITTFILESLFYTISGIILGFIVLYWVIVPYFSTHPLELPFAPVKINITQNIIATYSLSLILISIISGYIPSRTIVSKNIIETMRK